MNERTRGAKEFRRLLQRHAADIDQLPQRVMHLVRVGVVCAFLDDTSHDDGAHLVRANSAVELILDKLPGVRMLTFDSAARLIGRSDMRTGGAINRLEAAGILHQRNIGEQRYRVFEATDVIELFTDPPVRRARSCG